MVCGSLDNNPDTVNLMFSEYPDGSVCADYTADHRHQGYTGLLHGGMTSTLLDAAMTHCLFMQGVQALTAELTVRFISPVCTGDKLMVCARLLGQRRGLPARSMAGKGTAESGSCHGEIHCPVAGYCSGAWLVWQTPGVTGYYKNMKRVLLRPERIMAYRISHLNSVRGSYE